MIRLARRGKKNKAIYRLVVSEKARDTFGKALEIVGHYNPTTAQKEAFLNAERIQYWISKGAQTSPTVHNLLVEKQVITGEKIARKKEMTKKEKKK